MGPDPREPLTLPKPLPTGPLLEPPGAWEGIVGGWELGKGSWVGARRKLFEHA